MHQNAAQAALDRLDAASDGRGGNPEGLTGCEEALVTMDRQQDAKVVPRRLLALHVQTHTSICDGAPGEPSSPCALPRWRKTHARSSLPRRLPGGTPDEPEAIARVSTSTAG